MSGIEFPHFCGINEIAAEIFLVEYIREALTETVIFSTL